MATNHFFLLLGKGIEEFQIIKNENIYHSQKVLPITDSLCVYDNTKCMARTKTDITKQCSSKKKFGDFISSIGDHAVEEILSEGLPIA